MYQRAFDRVKGSLNLFVRVRSDSIDGVFTTDENELMTKSFSKSFMDFKGQGGVLTFCHSSLINVGAFIYTSDFKMHHFTLFFSNSDSSKMVVFKLSSISTKIKYFKKFEEYFRK